MTKAKSICKKLNQKARDGSVSFDDVNDINGLQLLGGAVRKGVTREFNYVCRDGSCFSATFEANENCAGLHLVSARPS